MRYTSPIQIAGLPLLSIVLEKPVNRSIFEVTPAVGVVAVGQYAFGVITISQFGAGVISVSQFGIGVVGIFQFGLAAVSISQFSINLIGGRGQYLINLGQYFGL